MLAGLGVRLEGIRTRALRDLERLNTETRYPDALPNALPSEYFTAEGAEEAISVAAGVGEGAGPFTG